MSGLAHSVPPLQSNAKACSRCGKDFHLFRSKKNCYNCGSMVCESCSNFRTKLPQFGYSQEVRCCAYCAHFLQVSKMDYAALSKLNIKTLRGYLLSYNIPTQGMLEKPDLIRAIQSYKPIPEASEVYFRQHLPNNPAKSSSLFEELTGLSRSESSLESSEASASSSISGDGWLGDVDKFFSKLFGADDRQSTAGGQTNSSRPQPQSQPGQHQSQSPSASAYRPQSHSPRAPNTGTNHTSAPHQHSRQYYRPPAGNPPSMSSYPSNQPTHTRSQIHTATQSPGSTQLPTRSNTASDASSTTSRPQASQSIQVTLTLEQLMTSKTDPGTLSIKVIKGLLDHSCVTYVGVVEKQDLVNRLQKLIDNTRAEQEMIQEQEAAAASDSKKSKESSKRPSSNTSDDDNLCKICCDAALNCVMLNCNHMSTCMDCGKLIMEGSRMCPICREYVVKLLHVFRA